MANSVSPMQLAEYVVSLPGHTRAVGTQVLKAEVGCVHLAVRKRPDLLQWGGIFHGGIITGLADFAAGTAVTTLLPLGRSAITIDLHVNFLSAADGDSIIAKAKAVQVGKSISVASVEVFTVQEREERLCALCTITLRNVEVPASVMGT